MAEPQRFERLQGDQLVRLDQFAGNGVLEDSDHVAGLLIDVLPAIAVDNDARDGHNRVGLVRLCRWRSRLAVLDVFGKQDVVSGFRFGRIVRTEIEVLAAERHNGLPADVIPIRRLVAFGTWHFNPFRLILDIGYQE